MRRGTRCGLSREGVGAQTILDTLCTLDIFYLHLRYHVGIRSSRELDHALLKLQKDTSWTVPRYRIFKDSKNMGTHTYIFNSK